MGQEIERSASGNEIQVQNRDDSARARRERTVASLRYNVMGYCSPGQIDGA